MTSDRSIHGSEHISFSGQSRKRAGHYRNQISIGLRYSVVGIEYTAFALSEVKMRIGVRGAVDAVFFARAANTFLGKLNP